MRKIVSYECEICKQVYTSEKQAKQCESKGIFNTDKFPAGLMFEYHHDDFVGIFSMPQDVKPIDYGSSRNHVGHSSYWACRTEKYPRDSLGEEKCGGDYFYSDDKWLNNWLNYHRITKEKTICNEFKRMVKFLKSIKIQPSYYNESNELIKIP